MTASHVTHLYGHLYLCCIAVARTHTGTDLSDAQSGRVMSHIYMDIDICGAPLLHVHTQVPIWLMHHRGDPSTMTSLANYPDDTVTAVVRP